MGIGNLTGEAVPNSQIPTPYSRAERMQFYTVHEPPEPPVDRIDRAGSLVFIGDRFTPQAVALGPFWLLSHQLWHAFLAYAGAIALVSLVVFGTGLSWRWITLMIGAFNLILGFEAPSLRRWALERKGWKSLGTVSGRTLDESERRFLETYLADQRIASAQAATPSQAGSSFRLASAATGDGMGGRLDGGRRRGWLTWRARPFSS